MPEFNLADEMLPKELKFVSSKVFKNGYLWDVVKMRNVFEICPRCAEKYSVQCGKVLVVVREA